MVTLFHPLNFRRRPPNSPPLPSTRRTVPSPSFRRRPDSLDSRLLGSSVHHFPVLKQIISCANHFLHAFQSYREVRRLSSIISLSRTVSSIDLTASSLSFRVLSLGSSDLSVCPASAGHSSPRHGSDAPSPTLLRLQASALFSTSRLRFESYQTTKQVIVSEQSSLPSSTSLYSQAFSSTVSRSFPYARRVASPLTLLFFP